MKKIFILALFCIRLMNVDGQVATNPFVKEMKWGIDFQIHLTFSNDSSYSVDVKDLFHTRSSSDSISDEFVYYPVMLASEFVDQLSINKIKPDNRQPQEPSANQPVFLWGIL
ncbi:MAG TPA: hypothetical protein VHO90_02015, partial [Bacteroidales bacterium]|nr:hypothetical protein [Bacteroidales bacterium]